MAMEPYDLDHTMYVEHFRGPIRAFSFLLFARSGIQEETSSTTIWYMDALQGLNLIPMVPASMVASEQRR